MRNWIDRLWKVAVWAFSGVAVRLVEWLLHNRRRIVGLVRMMLRANQFKSLEEIYLVFWEEECGLAWHGSFVKLKYRSQGEFAAMGRRPGAPYWDWDGYLKFEKFGKTIVGEGRYEYLNRENDFGRQDICYREKDGSLRVVVDNLSVTDGKKNFHTVWIPARLISAKYGQA